MTGWKRTLTVMFVAQLLAAVGFSTIFPFLPLYVTELGTRTGLAIEFWAGMVFSAQALTMMIASPLWGAVADRRGRKLMVERAMFGGAVIILLMAFARSAEELVLLRAIQGLITGTVAAANALVAASAPRDQTGYAMGLLQVGLWSGVALGPLIGGVTADLLGYRPAFVITAVLLLLGGLLVHFGIQETFTPPQGTGSRISLIGDWQRVLGTPGVMPVFAIRFAAWLGRNVLVPFAPLFIATLMADEARLGTATGLMIGLASAAGTASAVTLGKLGDRVGHRRVLIACSIVAAAAYLPQALVNAVWQLIALQIVTGAAVGGVMPSLSALLNHYTRPGEAGAVYGLDNAVVSASRAVAPIVGVMITVWFGLRGIFLATGLLFVLVTLLALWRMPAAPRDSSP